MVVSRVRATQKQTQSKHTAQPGLHWSCDRLPVRATMTRAQTPRGFHFERFSSPEPGHRLQRSKTPSVRLLLLSAESSNVINKMFHHHHHLCFCSCFKIRSTTESFCTGASTKHNDRMALFSSSFPTLQAICCQTAAFQVNVAPVGKQDTY